MNREDHRLPSPSPLDASERQTSGPVQRALKASLRDSLYAVVVTVPLKVKARFIELMGLSMKKLFLSSVALCAMVSMASAADLAARPYTKAPIVAPIYNWSGFYVGANGGFGSSHSCWDYQGDPGGCHNATGGTVGGQLGYRWQSSNWVFGLEAQGNWANFKGSSIDLSYPDYNDKTHIDSFGLFTGQVGYAWDNVLLYAKGGAAVVGFKYSNPQISPPRDYNGSVTRWGGAVGVGLEYGFARNWSVGVEWNHIFLGKKNVTVVNPADATDNFVEHIGENIDMGLVRVNYRF